MSYERLLDKVELFYRLATYGKRKDFLKSLGQAPQMLPEQVIVGNPPNASAPTTQVLPEVVEAYYPPIPAETQEQLSDLLVPAGLLAVPLKQDGKIGGETRKAMQAFIDKFHLPATPENIKAMWLKQRNPGLETKNPF